ncbi:MAG TPA: DNA polymerase IV [Bacillota bacterium]|nr:DNA polymerase IV [Bacillota bacterium]
MNPKLRTIAHIDMDCFFAAVEALDHPEYRGKPLIVGGQRDSPRAVVSTCSYEARKYGVRSAMPISQAARLCPDALFVTGNMRRYTDVSQQIMECLAEFTPRIQQISIDEAFLDMTGCEHFYNNAQAMGLSIKQQIREKTGLTASCGIAPNKFLAKLASSKSKPDGLLVITADEVGDLLAPLPVRELWGVGERGEQELARYGITTVSDLRAWPAQWLAERFGKWGMLIYDLARGIDDDPVVTDEECKSYGSESTFDSDVDDIDDLCACLARHAQRVGKRLRAGGKLARTVTLKVKFADFDQITRAKSVSESFDSDDDIYNIACELLRELDMRMAVRLIGVSVSGLTECRQLSLFESPRGKLDRVLDSITDRLGRKGVSRGRELE